MFDFEATWNALREWEGFLENHVPVDRWPPNPMIWSGVAVLGGFALAFWGARILRSIYVLGFMVIGATIGVRLAGVRQVDTLIGLVLGAGIAAIIAFLFFRWWVGLTTGLIAVLILLVAGAPRLNSELTGFNDHQIGVGTNDWTRSLRAPEELKLETWEQVRQYMGRFGDFVWAERKAALTQTVVGLALVWLLGTAAGLLLPRLVMVFGTSLLGTFLMAAGGSILLSNRWPGTWSGIVANHNWFMAGLAVLFLAALSYQARHRRAAVSPPTPMPATA